MRPFESFTWQHALPIVFFLLTGFFLIRSAKRSPEKIQTQLGVAFSFLIVAFMVGGSIIKLTTHTFNYKDDLPLYLCRIIAWLLPFAILFHNRYWLGIFYFWVLAGTLQGIVTPDLVEGFPSYFFFRYWFLHAGLVIAILYAVIVFKVRITWKDFWRAIGFAQVYLVLIHITNMLLGSNYSFTMRKPAGQSILDLFGPWPVYILVGEGLMIILFVLLMLPWSRRRSGDLQARTTVSSLS